MCRTSYFQWKMYFAPPFSFLPFIKSRTSCTLEEDDMIVSLLLLSWPPYHITGRCITWSPATYFYFVCFNNVFQNTHTTLIWIVMNNDYLTFEVDDDDTEYWRRLWDGKFVLCSSLSFDVCDSWFWMCWLYQWIVFVATWKSSQSSSSLCSVKSSS